MTVRTVLALGAVLFTCALPGRAWAQQASGIAGVVRDASGGVLPGVTVEAASPVLIEKVRTAVTDTEGRYNIVDLRPGTYAVTFTISGFNVLKREGIALTAGFTATVNADMQVGALEETITVTGEAPLVDTQNVRRQTVVSSELLDVLPTSNKSLQSLVTLTAGFTGSPDVAGSYLTQVGGAYHGKGGTNVQFDGMGIQHSGGNFGITPNLAMVEEVTLQTSGISAESNADGALVNMIPKEGGNTFRSTLFGLYGNDSMQSDNLNDDLRTRGLTTVNTVTQVYDGTFALGGPIKRDRLWFFGTLRWWGNGHQVAGKFWNQTQGTPFYTPDLSRPSLRREWYESKAIRLTWQATPKNKINVLVDRQRNCNCGEYSLNTGPLNAPEAVLGYHFDPDALYQATWTSPVTNKLLLEAGAAAAQGSWPTYMMPGVTENDISILEQATGMRYNANADYRDPQDVPRYTQRFSVAYVTGSHAFKTGFQLEEGIQNTGIRVNQDRHYTFRNGVPTSITQFATPYLLKNRTKAELGIYAQDQWAIRRLTLNLGVRYDYFNGYVPEQIVPATPSGWIPERRFDAVKDVPNWKDINPRIGAAYDLFGSGRTAIKVSMGRYVAKTTTAIANANNPVNSSVNQVTRTWTDLDRDYVPDCNLGDFASNGECGAISNTNFGGRNVTTQSADDAIRGFGARGSNWDLTTELQHQLSGGVSLSAGYYRNWYGSFLATDNTLVTPADFDTYCITAPRDSRLPGGGGYQVCGLADVSLAKFGRVNSVITQSSNFGEESRVNDFVNLSVNARLREGARLGASFDTGRTVTDRCFVVDSPQQLVNCHEVIPFSGQTQIKVFGSLPLPGDVLVSGIFQNYSGPMVTATYAATNAEIAPSLGRNLSACGTRTPCTATATVPLIPSGEMFEDRITRIDLRLTKLVNIGRTRVQGNVDLYNLLNNGAIVNLTTAYGSQWLRPTQVVDGRMVQFSAQINF
jgi:hypothetical protein